MALRRTGFLSRIFSSGLRRKTSPSKFVQLPPPVLSKIAAFIPLSLDAHQSVLDLLPLRLLHPAFIQHITRSIFRDCKVQGAPKESVIRSDKSIPIREFLNFMKYPHLRQHVRKLTVDVYVLNHAEDSPMAAGKAICHLLSRVAETVQVLHVQPGNLIWIPLPSPGLNSDFTRLRSLTLDRANMPFLYGILARCPRLSVLRINGESQCKGYYSKRYNYSKLYEDFFVEWKRQSLTPKVLDMLEVNHANGIATLHVLKQVALLPKEVYLAIDGWDAAGLRALIQGAAMCWPVFSAANSIFLTFVNPGEERLSDIIEVLHTGGLKVDSHYMTKQGVVLSIQGVPRQEIFE